ncbi:16S rRNA (cytidine(1402)-2'-O)-methyltransferase [Helicobacter muridarum]|uniref:16S rRNA (Cytidine(1402)-2'-O)-methyltransferase n=1 Tax=Helicobacter muridarum TaxID=216 RepID=A0A099U0E2_9HELI|nr:16S rRNA (cytidine(1402)-2'-O)-methyltransferase [Helicobacter muridarum]TLE00165.1 16S rRNA (cytidine(1402)-2'-O)-methyltransferase [Helicobacter muridarum]STQ87028.1 putative methyltransferase [Helicobacter muridarum]
MLVFVPTPIGNIDDISIRTLRAFNDADIILCEDSRVTKKLLSILASRDFIKLNFTKIDSKTKRFISFHSHNQQDFLSSITPVFFDSFVVCCSDAGMPCINDPGALLVQYAKLNNIKYDILPGGSAFSLAFANSGLQGEFCFLGFFPHKQQDRIQRLKDLQMCHNESHMIFYESPKRLKCCLQDIADVFPHAHIYVYKELTKLYQNEYEGYANVVLQNLPDNVKGEYCIIIERDKNAIFSKKLCLSQEEILSLPIGIKYKAKMLAEISDQSSKQWYAKLLNK